MHDTVHSKVETFLKVMGRKAKDGEAFDIYEYVSWDKHSHIHTNAEKKPMHTAIELITCPLMNHFTAISKPSPSM